MRIIADIIGILVIVLVAQMVEGATLKIYPGAPHDVTATHKDLLNKDLLSFLRS